MLMHLLRFILGFLLIGLVVFIHELGHFFAARLLKVDVEVLSYGMGPKVIAIYGKNTEFRISALPFGGYCRMKGSIDLSKALSDDKRSMDMSEAGSYFSCSPLRRLLIYFAGPLTNFILAFLLLSFSAMLPVERITNEAFIAPTYLYADVFPNINVVQSQIFPGDKVLSVDGIAVSDYQDFVSRLSKSSSGSDLLIARDGKKIIVHVTPEYIDGGYVYGLTLYQKPVISNPSDSQLEDGDEILKVNGQDVSCTLDVFMIDGDELILTMQRDGKEFTYKTDGRTFPFAWKNDLKRLPDASGIAIFSYGIANACNYFITTLKTLGALICFNVDDARMVITGPVKAAQNIGNISMLAFSYSANDGIRTMFHLLAVVSISLCIGNILPIPTFDGGQMLINTAEIIKKGNLKPKTYVCLQIFGMLMAVLIMVMMYSLDIKAFFFRK